MTSSLSPTEVDALEQALDDEFQSWTTYDQVIADFGEIRPFTNIRDAEGRHIDALLALFARYGLAAPTNSWSGRVARYASVHEACEANAALYDRLLAATQQSDILAVFRRLQEASQQRHLAAFRRCAERSAGGGGGQQRRRGLHP
jgi:hypothetical protein